MLSLARSGLILMLALMLGACATIVSKTTGRDGVQEDTSRRTTGAIIDDGNIETMIKVNLNAAHDSLRAANVQVNSFNGIVLLTGQVPDQDMKNLATRVANTTSSRVRTVHNELEITPNTSMLTRSNDALLTTRIKTIMLAHNDLSSLRTKVITENGVVFLMGLMSREEGAKAVDVVSKTQGVNRVVNAFEYFD
jgi:osmotically-inducible protein OsmY